MYLKVKKYWKNKLFKIKWLLIELKKKIKNLEVKMKCYKESWKKIIKINNNQWWKIKIYH